MRTALKHAIENTLCGGGFTAFSRRLNRTRTVILAYHNIVPDGAPVTGDISLHLRQAAFAEQLDLLSRTHDIVPLTDVISGRATDKPRAAITFDDAYSGALTAGVAELAKRGLPATMFVAPAFIGGESFWWDVLASDNVSVGLQPLLREKVLHDLAGSDAQARRWAAESGLPRQHVPAHEVAGTESDLANAVATGVITLGSHTWSHPNLAQLDRDQLEEELTRPLTWLRERFDAVVPLLSYPYGLRSREVEHAAERAGYGAAFLITGGWLRDVPARSGERFALPRLNVPAGLSLRGFEMRTSGILMS